MQQLLMEREKNWSNLRNKLDETITAKETLYNEHLDLIQQFNKYKDENQNEPTNYKNLINQKINEYEAMKNEKKNLAETNNLLMKEMDLIKTVRSFLNSRAFNHNKVLRTGQRKRKTTTRRI